MNDNKKIIIVVILIIVLVGTIYFLNKGAESKGVESSAPAAAEKSATEIKLTSILSSIDGVGATDVMINESQSGILGVVIVCEGADNLMVRNDIINAVSTALNIDKKIIAIYSMTI